MKNRPTKHKAENAFRFKKFSDRIQEIDIRRGVLYHIDHVGEDEPTEDESYFYLALQKWQVLNLTEEYEKFYKPVRDIVTLPQVLLKKEFIFEHLFECLQSATNLSLQALLEFVVILAKELQEYFCEWLPKILYKLTTLLQDKDAEVVEWTLICLAYLFKHLKKHLKKDFSLVLNLVMPILDDRRRKEHIQNFAIECFSYVARDIRDRNQLFQLVVRFCADNPNVVKSCGHLLFQIVHGVPGQFHSCAESFFVSLFDAVQRKGSDLALWSELLNCFQDAMLHEIAPKQVELYWNCFMKRLVAAVDQQKTSDVEYFPLYLRATLQLVKFKKGAFISNHKQIIDLLLILMKMQLSVDNERTVCELVIAVLSARTVNLTHLEANQLIRAALKVRHYENFEYFILHSMSYAQFEQLIFPALLAALEGGTYPLDRNSLELICRVLQHKNPIYHDGVEYDNFRPGIMDCSWAKYPRIDAFLQELLCAPSQRFLSDPDCCLALVACRYDKSSGHNDATAAAAARRTNAALVLAAEELWAESGAKSNDGENLNGTALFSYCLIMEHLVAVAKYDQLRPEHIIQNLLPLCSSRSSSSSINSSSSSSQSFAALRLLDLLLTYCARHLPDRLTYDLFQRIHAPLSDGLCSPRHDVRLLVTHSLALFAHVDELACDNELFIYELMNRVEATEASIETYRGQLQLLQKLTYDSLYQRTFAAKEPRLRLDMLKYLLGVLYLNFKLIWQPTMDTISSYGQHMDADAFWQIYKRQLTAGIGQPATAELSEGVIGGGDGEEQKKRGGGGAEGKGTDRGAAAGAVEESARQEVGFTFANSPTLSLVQTIRCDARYKPDFVNYRKHIWSLLPNFRLLLERKNRELVTMFFDFYERQYRMHMEKLSNVRKNIRIVVEDDEPKEEDDGEDVDPDDVDEEEGENEDASPHSSSAAAAEGDRVTKLSATRVTAKGDSEDEDQDDEPEEEEESQWDGKMFHGQLMNYLSMFQNLPNPRTVYKSKQLYDVYVDLLAHKNAQIQKLALDCLLSYRDKVLDVYKDQLSRLIEEKTFRDELNSFGIAEGSTATPCIPREHRAPVMKLLRNILYGKMYTRLVAAKKGAVQARKTLVMRYLNGCTDEELMAFIKLCFGPFAHLLLDEDEDALSLDEAIERVTDISLESTLHAKYLQSVVSLIDTMLEQFGTKGDRILRTLFKLLLLCLATVQAIILQSEMGNRISGLQLYKGVRREAGALLRRFFDMFDRYEFSGAELEAVFRFVVWPAIDNMPNDCASVPTALFKLFHTWTKSPRYFVLLTKYRNPDRDVNPLAQVMKLLQPNKSSTRVANTILDMVHNLLTLDLNAVNAGGDGDVARPLTCQLDCILPLSTEVQQRFEGVVNFGSLILVPHLDTIIERLRVKLGQQQRKRRQQHVAKEVTGKRDLLILNRITELVVDKEKCDVLVALLLPILTSRTAGMVANEGAMVQMIGSLICLFKKTSCPERHIRTVAPLFESATQVGPRKLLSDLFGTFEDRPLAALIVELNAMNRRWVDQPDYDRRLSAFRVIDEWMANGEMDMNRGLVVLYHVFYFLRCDKDLAMKSTSSYCLKKTVLHLADKFQQQATEKQYLFEAVVLRAIKRGIVGPTETVRSECIALLGDLARNYPHVHYVFADLQPLTNAQDREVDFFENLIHLQTHRHARALTKFVQLAKAEGTQMNYRTLMDYVYPMVAVYLCNEKFVHNNALIDTTIECVAAVCKLLPFYQFQTVLRVFIKKLRTNIDYQKQMVKLVVAIIDEFHFDFSHFEASAAKVGVVGTKVPTGNGKEKPSKVDVAVAEKGIVGERESDKVKMKKIKAKDVVPVEDEEEEDENDDDDDDDEDEDDDKDLKDVKRETKTILKRETKKQPQQQQQTHSEYVLMMGLVQSLNNSVFELSARDSAHKANKQEQRRFEEEEILKVPIALATVQLLKKVSKKLLDQNLAKILMKMCSYLKSRLKSVRIITRDILRKMMLVLGPAYLHILLDLLTTLLSRGFQVHVLVVTLHNILDAMRPTLAKDGAMDQNMARVLTVCLGDVFGQAAEEKEVAKIGSKTPEAKTSTKSYGILNIMAATISEKCLLDVVVPFKEQLSRTNSAKVVNKVQICFNKIINGLMENKSIGSKSYLAFVFGILTENIAHLRFTLGETAASGGDGDGKAAAAPKRARIERPDIYLIADEHSATRRREELIKKSALTNAHVLNEFALNLLHSVLKNEKLDAGTFGAYVNPIVPHLLELIMGQHVRVITLAVKCISAIWNRQIPLEHLDGDNARRLSALVDRLFEILRKYSGQDLSTNDENYQLIKASFKAIMSLIRFVDKYAIGSDQLKSLLFYVDQDLHNKQGIAFPLLRAIIAKKMFVPELHETMQGVCKMAITSDAENVREEARQILMVFFLEYPLGERFAGHMKFFMSQLGYEMPAGRESAVRMLQVIMRKVPKNVMAKNLSMTFLTLGTRMVNDDQPSIRALVSRCIEELVQRTDKKRREELFNVVLALFDDPQPSHVEMAALYCGRFLNTDTDFEQKIPKILPVIVRKLTVDKSMPGRFVREMGLAENEAMAPVDEVEGETALWLQKARDHQLIQLLHFTARLFEKHAGILKQTRYSGDVDELAYVCQRLLAYEHAWVRYNAAKVIGQILQSIDFELLRNYLARGRGASEDDDEAEGCKTERLYMYSNPRDEIKSLVLDLCAQLRPDSADAEMAEEVMKNLLIIAVMLRDVPLNVTAKGERKEGEENDDDDEDGEEDEARRRSYATKSVNLIWLIRRVNYIANSEVIHTPHAILLRKAIFSWIEGLVNVLDKPIVATLAPLLLATVMREVSPDNNNTHAELKRLGNKIITKLRKAAGDTELNEVLNKLQQRQMQKRAERKTKEALEKIQNPEKAVKRRVSQLQSKKMAKRRKMDIIKGKLAPQRKRKLRETNEDFL